ncbi:MAG: ATP-binding cassette domain-containing protein [Candidatus Parvarchaeota archaeon]
MSSIIEIDQATKEFVTKRGLLKRTTNITRALDWVSLTINENETFRLIGESGSGKTTLGLAMLRLIGLNGGKIYFGGEDIFSLKKKQLFNFREKGSNDFSESIRFPQSGIDCQ